MTKPVINLADVELSPRPAAFAPPESMNDRYGGVRIGRIGPVVGARKLGYNLTAVPPGKRAYPFHVHRVNEEMFLVLEGTGVVRIGETTYAIGAGDIVACPPGGAELAHQIVNTGDTELKYLAVSTMTTPEIAEYPDSGKFGVMAELPGKAGEPSSYFRFVSRQDASLSYWEDN